MLGRPSSTIGALHLTLATTETLADLHKSAPWGWENTKLLPTAPNAGCVCRSTPGQKAEWKGEESTNTIMTSSGSGQAIGLGKQVGMGS